MPDRSMVKVLLADNFFPPGDAEIYAQVADNLNFIDTEYGQEIPNFNMIFPDSNKILSKVIGEEIEIIEEKSGIFRKPLQCTVRFESFWSLDEWCFIVALEPTTFNLYYHIKDGCGDFGTCDARSALDGTNFNYKNLFEWNIDVNIILQPNQGVFFRPWMFHSLEKGLVQYYRMKAKK